MRRFAKKFTLTCSYRPIFVCFVRVTTFLVALEALICSLLFSKCSAKNYRLSLILTGQYQHLFPGCQPSSKIPHQIKSTQARLPVPILQTNRSFPLVRYPDTIMQFSGITLHKGAGRHEAKFLKRVSCANVGCLSSRACVPQNPGRFDMST